MKKILAVAAVLALLFCIAGCGKKSGLEGKVLDGKGKPIAGIKILAKMEQPVKGYEQFEAVTESDGTFTFKKMYPASKSDEFAKTSLCTYHIENTYKV